MNQQVLVKQINPIYNYIMRIWACQENGRKRGKKKPSPQKEKENAHGFKRQNSRVLFRVPDSRDDALREIAEFFAEQVDAADVRRVRMDTDAQGNVLQRVELQIRDGDA